jgi:hypothetical protein
MTKGSTGMRAGTAEDYIGLDLSDKTATYVVLPAGGEVVQNGKLKLSQTGCRGRWGQGRRRRLPLKWATTRPGFVARSPRWATR